MAARLCALTVGDLENVQISVADCNTAMFKLHKQAAAYLTVTVARRACFHHDCIVDTTPPTGL